MRIWLGGPYPLGASVLDTTTGYALEDEETAAMAGEEPMAEARSIQVLRRV